MKKTWLLIIAGILILIFFFYWFSVEAPQRDFDAKLKNCEALAKGARLEGRDWSKTFDQCMIYTP